MNTSLKCLKMNQNAYTSHILCIWSVWAFASMCIYCCTKSTTPLRAFLHSDWYTPEAPTFSPFSPIFCISAFSQGEFSCQGGVFVSTLNCAWWIHLSTRGRDFEIFGLLTRGERFCAFQASALPIIEGEISALGNALTRRDLSHLELLLVVLSHLPLSRGTSFAFSFCAVFCSNVFLIAG